MTIKIENCRKNFIEKKRKNFKCDEKKEGVCPDGRRREFNNRKQNDSVKLK